MKRQEYSHLQDLYEKEGRSVAWSLAHVLMGKARVNRSAIISSAYVLSKAEEEDIDLTSIHSFCLSANNDEDREAFFDSSIGDVWPLVVGQKDRYPTAVLQSIIIFFHAVFSFYYCYFY